MTIIVVILDVFYVCALCASELGFILLTTNITESVLMGYKLSMTDPCKLSALSKIPVNIVVSDDLMNVFTPSLYQE